ncbi:MAG: hypothetical protein N2047_04175 [Meiothermus sp.]|nr:hypothetical protein [Meiothermus sp.]
MKEYHGIERLVASHRYTSATALEKLSWHPEAEVRRLVARHPNTDEATRRRLLAGQPRQETVCA